MFKVGFVGAGSRARTAHYPTLSRFDDVSIEAVAELDDDLMNQVAQQYDIPHTFDDYHKMLAQLDLDAVYVILGPEQMTGPALDCLIAGCHVFIEKPAGGSLADSQRLLDAALENDRFCMVGFQRRFADITQEAVRLVNERGGPTLAVGQFHKARARLDQENVRELWWDGCHVVDLVRYMVGSEPVEVTAYQTAHAKGRENNFNSLIRFASGAVGIISVNRNAGGRYIRAELHGDQISCVLRLAGLLEVLKDGEVWRRGDEEAIQAHQIHGRDAGDSASWNGNLAMNRHFFDCLASGEVPLTDIRDVIKTSRLVDQLAGGYRPAGS